MPSEHATFKTVAERFGWNLKIARQRVGLTQHEVAARLGMQDSCDLSVWETGRQCPGSTPSYGSPKP